MLKPIKTATILFFLFLTSITLYSQEKDNFKPFFFIQLTDPQFGFIEANKGFAKETELYQKAVSEINTLKPDFVVITGDMVNNRDDKTQITEFKRITAQIDSKIPVYYTPGNHDIGQKPTQQDIDTFIKDYGYDRFSFIHKNSLFIGLNSSLIKSNTPQLEQIQFDWLEKMLSKGEKAKHIVIFCHYPFFISSPDEEENYSNIGDPARNRYLTLFRKYNVNVVFAGHLHNNGYGKYYSMEMITTSAVGKQLGKAASGFRVVKVLKDKIESNYYQLDQMPETVRFTDR